MVKDNVVDYLLSETIETNNQIEFFSSKSKQCRWEKSKCQHNKTNPKGICILFIGIGCFEETFSLQVKPDSKPYQAPLWCVAYALQKTFKVELEKLQRQDIITPLGVDETVERCNSFILVTKANGIVKLSLDLARLNQSLIRLVHRGPTLKDIFPKLNNIKPLSLIDVSSGYHNLQVVDRSSFLATFAYQFGRYRYKRLPFGIAPTGDMFQHKINEIFKDLPNVFGIADAILVLWYDGDGKDHDET